MSVLGAYWHYPYKESLLLITLWLGFWSWLSHLLECLLASIQLYIDEELIVRNVYYVFITIYILTLDYQGDIIFSARNVTMSSGDRMCFDLVIVDDAEIEYKEEHSFHVKLSNGTYLQYYNQSTTITINDNDGE